MRDPTKHHTILVERPNAELCLRRCIGKCYDRRVTERFNDLFDGNFDSEGVRDEVTRARWKSELGIDLPEQRPDTEAPPVNEDAVLSLLSRGLSEKESREVFHNVLVYRTWREAFGREVMRRYESDHQTDLPNESTSDDR